MIHYGINNGVLKKFCDLDHDFEAEFNALISPTVIKKFAKNKVEIISFNDL